MFGRMEPNNNRLVRGGGLAERMFRVDTSGECWPWMGARTADGYGIIRFGGTHHMAHRLSYEENIGPIPDGLLVLHECDNPPCVRPEHLFVGTNKDNALDKMAKGRHWAQRITECPQGHPYDEANTYIKPTGARACRECGRKSARERMRRLRAR